MKQPTIQPDISTWLNGVHSKNNKLARTLQNKIKIKRTWVLGPKRIIYSRPISFDMLKQTEQKTGLKPLELLSYSLQQEYSWTGLRLADVVRPALH